jgi:hypothetical protein
VVGWVKHGHDASSAAEARLIIPTTPCRETADDRPRQIRQISELEGIVMTRRMKERVTEFERMGLSARERRRSIIRAYSKE